MPHPILNSEICSRCIVREICAALVPGGSWDPAGTEKTGKCPALMGSDE